MKVEGEEIKMKSVEKKVAGVMLRWPGNSKYGGNNIETWGIYFNLISSVGWEWITKEVCWKGEIKNEGYKKSGNEERRKRLLGEVGSGKKGRNGVNKGSGSDLLGSRGEGKRRM